MSELDGLTTRDVDVDEWSRRMDKKRAQAARFRSLDQAAALASHKPIRQPAARGRSPRPTAAGAGRPSGAKALKAALVAAGITSATVRAWAAATGAVALPPRGPIPRHAIDAYLAAHAEEQP